MRCVNPLTAWEDRAGGPIRFSPNFPTCGRQILLGCGKASCIGCQLDKSADWGLRAIHERRYHDAACFYTPTFRDADLPESPEEAKHVMRRFMKRLRKRLGARQRFFGCLELGERLSRPHGHFIHYGHDFTVEAEPAGKSKTGFPQFRSAELEELWGLGHIWVSEFTPETANYVARYCVEAQDQPVAVDLVHPVTGELVTWPTRYRPFYPLSPPLGVRFVDEFTNDVWSGIRAPGGARCRTPRAYSRALERIDPARFDELKQERIAAMCRPGASAEYEPHRCKVREEVMRAKLRFLSQR